jgi:hypothetical protein
LGRESFVRSCREGVGLNCYRRMDGRETRKD